MNTKANNQNYDEDSIRVLKGLEPVKERPGMYTRTENPLHIIQEVIDNAADEALGGFGNTIAVTLHSDGMVSIEDDGRGIPIGIHPEEGVPVIEIVFTRLHAGGKFNKKDGGAYAFSGGLHGVGVSVTNALSTYLGVTVWRDKQVASLVFSAGDVVEQLEVRDAGRGDKKNGTRVTVKPDPKYFDSPNIPLADLERVLRAKAVLLPGVKVALTHEKTGQEQTWFYEDGLNGYLKENLDAEPMIPFFGGEWYAPEGDDTFARGEGAAWVLAWTQEGGLMRESYVNLISTPAGGTHEAGVREGVFGAVKSFIELHALLPKGVKLISDDVFARTSFVLSAKVLDPQFQGQTKERLNNRDAVKLVAQATRPALELWLNQHVDYGKQLAELVIAQAQARNKAAQKVEKRKSSGVAVLPGKLTDCESTDLTHNELFLVEGDSAGGSAKMGRDKEFQAILPLRGKVLNTLEVDKDRLFANNEVHDIAVAIGVDPHGPNDTPDVSSLRYGKICILSDADVDGSHIQVLLLTLFYKHFPKLIELGHIYIARPPLFRVDVPARGKKLAQKVYCLDTDELIRIQDKLLQDGAKEGAWQVSRFKGLGEMNADQLWETTMNPDTRRLSQVVLNTERVADDGASKIMMTMLMGKTEASSRRAWIEEKGNLVNADI
jgi:topoisomerase-4 subunit B